MPELFYLFWIIRFMHLIWEKSASLKSVLWADIVATNLSSKAADPWKFRADNFFRLVCAAKASAATFERRQRLVRVLPLYPTRFATSGSCLSSAQLLLPYSSVLDQAWFPLRCTKRSEQVRSCALKFESDAHARGNVRAISSLAQFCLVFVW